MAAIDEVEFVDHPLVVSDAVERRAYQVELAAAGGSGNTLVCLPTGLGKTVVSLLVTADRLYETEGKAVLLAPTKPLVRQHAGDYRAWLEIPDEEIVVLTGEVRPADRAERWADARVVIATPQVVENDLIGGRVSLEDVVHCTFDECHRATGEYAYTYIADRYRADARDPLVTGLSASPGDDTEQILRVCKNLGIERVEVRSEEDESVAPYAHQTSVEWVQVELPAEVEAIRDRLHAVIEDRLADLQELGVTRSSDPRLAEAELRRIRGRLQELVDAGESAGYEGVSVHAELRKLKAAVTYVETQSVDALGRYFERQENAARSSGASKASQRFVSDPRIREAMRLAEGHDELHPKFRRARMLIAETLGIEGGSRVIVFTESRDTAEALTEFLGGHFSVRRFVGQSDREGSAGMSQRDQVAVLDAFRAGEFEVLVSTSVAEEGLDVPEVDLVLFYEPVPTAIRAIQRKGRTGRQARGRVVVLIAEDTRDEAFFWISRRREDQMRAELRSLKATTEELEAVLRGEAGEPVEDGQAGLAAFADPESPAADGAEADDDDEDEDDVVVVIDQRELDAGIGRALSKRDGVRVRLETLDVGDYVLSDRVVVERKTASDFLATLTGEDRSVFEQARDMTRHYDRPVLIIEGAGSVYEERDIHPNAIRGAIASLAVDYGVSVLRTADEADTLELLVVIARREQTTRERGVRVHGEKTAKTLREQQEYVVSSIAEVGPVTARALLEHFGSVQAVLAADADALVEVDGVGEVTAERIREVVASTYDARGRRE